MIYSLTFDNGSKKRNTWDDWKLLAIKRPVFVAPEPRKKEIVVPGMNGVLDLSKALTGEMLYEMRKGKLSFRYIGNENFPHLHSEILNFLHGQDVKIIQSDMPDYYLEGTVTVESPTAMGVGEAGEISIGYNLYPYMKWLNSTGELRLWDELDMDSNMVFDGPGSVFLYEGDTEFSFYGDAHRVSPTIYLLSANGEVAVTINGETYQINGGANSFPELKFGSGRHAFMFHCSGGTADVLVDYRGERL